jgi:hypothetical protein
MTIAVEYGRSIARIPTDFAVRSWHFASFAALQHHGS